jgi:hypothetical protein
MTLILDTRQIPEADRADAVRETIASTVVKVNIDFAESGPSVQGAITDIGQLRVCSVRSNAIKVERTPLLARDSLPPSIFLAVQLAGSSLIVQRDREAVLRPATWPSLTRQPHTRCSTARASGSTSSASPCRHWHCPMTPSGNWRR